MILTHIHLDHAGGAGRLMEILPDAKLVVHPRGARHMVSPGKLVESVKHVYGEEKFNSMYGKIIPVAQDRILEAEDGIKISIGSKMIRFYNAPGHAKHHIIAHDVKEGIVFSGDSFGIGYPLLRNKAGMLIFPSTSPVQFDPESAVTTYRMISNLNPKRVYLTHFGFIEDVKGTAKFLEDIISFSVETGNRYYDSGARGEMLEKAIYNDLWSFYDNLYVKFSGRKLNKLEKEMLFLDVDLNSKGVAYYLEQSAGK